MKIKKITQVVYGLILILSGLNAFFSFLPIPEKQGFAGEFLSTLHRAGYLFPLIATVMTTAGILLVINRWVALALLIQFPVSVNILAFHLFHDQAGLAAAGVIFGLNNLMIMTHFNQLKRLTHEMA